VLPHGVDWSLFKERTVIVDHIVFEPDRASLMRKLHLKADSPYADDFDRVVSAAQAIARPKALYDVGYIEARNDTEVVIGGVTFTSRVLRQNLEQAHCVYAYVATCGTELEAWAQSLDDMLERFWADAIMEAALRGAMRALKTFLDEHHRLGHTATMNPGSLPDWPLDQQRALFALLGDPEAAVGVHLTDSCLMVPAKSVSGIFFRSETGYVNCQLCPRPDCPGRQAPFDPALYEQYFSSSG
jgi:hypothetical protein